MLFHPRWDAEIIFTPAAANMQHLQRGAVDLSHLDARDDREEFKHSPGTRIQQELLASIQGKWPGHGGKVWPVARPTTLRAQVPKQTGSFDPG